MQIFVKLLTGKTITLNVVITDKVQDIKKRVAEASSLVAEAYHLIYSGHKLEDDKTLEDYTIPKEATLFIITAPGGSMIDLKKDVQLNIKMPNGATEEVTISRSSTVDELKARIAAKVMIPQKSLILVFKGQKLDDGSVLAKLGISNQDVINIMTGVQG